jgi:site-specific recombinase XerD
MDDARVDAFLLHLGAERRLSPNTVEAYGHDLQMLGAFAAGRGRTRQACGQTWRRSSAS